MRFLAELTDGLVDGVHVSLLQFVTLISNEVSLTRLQSCVKVFDTAMDPELIYRDVALTGGGF